MQQQRGPALLPSHLPTDTPEHAARGALCRAGVPSRWGSARLGVHARFVLKRRKSWVLEEQGTRSRSRCTETGKPAQGVEFKGLRVPRLTQGKGRSTSHNTRSQISILPPFLLCSW